MAALPNRSNTIATRMPLAIGVGSLVVFLLTLNHWVSLLSLGNVARVSGLLWRPQLDQPLTALVFYPFSFLPPARMAVAMNLCSAVCASIVLMLLARSVALLPHDLRRNDPFPTEHPATVLSISTAWIPPLLASILCALQLSFWEHATSASGEMIDLLVFAYVIRCLLEFRLDQKQSWLSRAALVFGAGMANNWAMMGFFPLFVIALIRVKGYGPFRDRSFLARMIAWGMAGFSLILLLPLVQALSPGGQVGFWTALKAHLKAQLDSFGYLRRPRFRLLALASLLPVLVLSIRWKAHTVQFGDDTRLGIFLTKITVHVLHGLFFFIALWIALDPTFSPRNLELGTPMLSYYYLSALAFGYCAGYLLLFGSPFTRPPKNTSLPPRSPKLQQVMELLPRAVPAVAVAIVCITPALLLWRNLDQITQTNGPSLRQFSKTLYADLPAGKSAVLSGELIEFLLLEVEARGRKREKAPILVDAPSLVSDQYLSFMARRYRSRWPSSPPPTAFSAARVLSLVESLAAREPLVYLNPAFGPVFELFTPQLQGSVCFLAPRLQNQRITPAQSGAEPVQNESPKAARARQTNSIQETTVAPRLTRAIIDANEQLWRERWNRNLQDLAKKVTQQHKRGNGGKLQKKFLLKPQMNLTLSFVGAGYAKRLNYWAVQLRRQGHAAEAKTQLGRAVALNPENLTAQINLAYAESNSETNKPLFTVAAMQNQFPILFAKYYSWREVLEANGPVDEPLFLFRTGRMLLTGGNSIQAIEEFTRCTELAPDWAASKLWLAKSYLNNWEFGKALQVTDELDGPRAPKNGSSLALLLECRAVALGRLGRTNEEAVYLHDFIIEHANESEVVSVGAEIYGQNGQYNQELILLEELLKRMPNRPDLLYRKGLAQLELSRYDAAISTLSSTLGIVPRNENARLCRAVAYLGSGNLEAARADYEEVLRFAGNPRNALYGLGNVAWFQQQTNLAIRYYEQYLSNQVADTHQELLAAQRLTHLKTQPPK